MEIFETYCAPYFNRRLFQHELHSESYPSLRRAAYEEHCAIFDAICEKDPVTAREVMRKHLSNSAQDNYGLSFGMAE